MPYDDFQSFLSVFTQISPAVDTFGWKIFVANQPVPRQPPPARAGPHTDESKGTHFGGAAGNSSVKLNLTLK